MKTKALAVIVSGTAVVALCLAGACFPQTSSAQTESAPPPPPDDSAAQAAPDNPPALPPGIYPSSPLAEVIKLTQGGVSEEVIMAYVTNSGSTFNLDPDKIIYLKDIGTPDDLVTAMIQRDQVLQAQTAAAGYQPPPQPAPTVETTTTEVAPPPPEVTVNYFYDTLSPYGTWVDVDGYGRCWRPTAVIYNSAWQPYCDHGHWVWTDDGWYWMSDYSWGWAPFHYGRWFHHERFGWCWTPDTVWGPSWVTWRYANDYCGWAPLPPRAVFREGVGFVYNGGGVSVGFDFGLNVGAFTFVHTRDFCDPHPRRHRIEAREATEIFNHTTVINNFDVDRRNRTFINHGIDPQHITQVTHAPIHPVAIHDTTGPIARGEQLGRDGHTLFVNRPHFNDNPDNNRGVTPHNPPVARPMIGSPYQTPNNHGNDNSSPPHRIQPTTPTPPSQPLAPRPTIGSPYQPPNNHGKDNSQPQAPRNDILVSPGHNGTTTPIPRPSPPVNHYVPPTPVQPPGNINPNNSSDNRRYSSPRMQQFDQQNPRGNPGNNGNHVATPVTPPSPTVRPPEANHFTPPAPPVAQPAPAAPQQRTYVSPRSETPPSQSRPNYSQPPVQGNQSRGGSTPSAPAGQSQNSGRGGKNQNGQ